MSPNEPLGSLDSFNKIRQFCKAPARMEHLGSAPPTLDFKLLLLVFILRYKHEKMNSTSSDGEASGTLLGDELERLDSQTSPRRIVCVATSWKA